MTPAQQAETRNELFLLRDFIGANQRSVLSSYLRGEEASYFAGKIRDLTNTIRLMPKTYDTDGQGSAALVRLHYFIGGMDWHITERDREPEQLQAFGSANLGHGGELGYISIAEIIRHGAELDLHWQTIPLSKIHTKD